jgi:hypothetical protein
MPTGRSNAGSAFENWSQVCDEVRLHMSGHRETSGKCSSPVQQHAAGSHREEISILAKTYRNRRGANELMAT